MSAPARAEDDFLRYCIEEMEAWEIMCLETSPFPDTDCVIEDVCMEDQAQEEALEEATITIPDDTPEGFEEKIYILP